MAMQKRFPVEHSTVFPNGAFLHGEVTPVADFNAPAGPEGQRPQQRDKDTDLPLWQCVVIDGDEEAGRRDIGVTVKIAAKYQPVPPENKSPIPWTPVEFVGLTALPYVDDNGNRPRIAWSFRASDLVAPGQGRTDAKPPESKPESKAAA
ncbi:plasmid replication, integration and excision activator [Isoptericola cucumis]|uniref:Plasmid replication, integration and excision activator n=1 Tax=Isoptericola cucumis TaxID=1776856 RepID=A0ABQ2B723_9MICO|nr:plasmid replication, integration and excision activator [Isoptericola cucumis]GGI07533.1 hypothetical protein GCM10007368_16640 [Isoptericola cucumis]